LFEVRSAPKRSNKFASLDDVVCDAHRGAYRTHGVVVNESDLEIILHNIETVKRRGEDRDYPDPGQLYDSVTDTRTSQACVRHV
jgi:hypothetical protein